MLYLFMSSFTSRDESNNIAKKVVHRYFYWLLQQDRRKNVSFFPSKRP